MPTLADVRNEINKALTATGVPGPLYAVAGVGDLAVEKLRALELDRRLADLPVEARALPGRAQTLRADVRDRVLRFPGEVAGTVVGRATGASDRATETYEDLTARGRKLVDRISHQQATRDLVDGAQEVVRSAKATATSVRHGGENARSAAKRTATTARRTASDAAGAAGAAAAKTGDGVSAPAGTTTNGTTTGTGTGTASAKKAPAKKATAKKAATRKPAAKKASARPSTG